MNIPEFLKSYPRHTQHLIQKHPKEQAMALAVGGDFTAVGQLEYFLLRQYGLQAEHTLIDVGCGSGRLAFQLKNYLNGLYIGLDVVPELFEYAAQITGRPDWRFYQAPGLMIPEPDNSADFICFFSVFTHLQHEETYLYLQEAKRVVVPGGKIIFSFLEFAIPSHWTIFEGSLADTRPDKVLNQFMSRDAITAWCRHLNLMISDLQDGDKPHIDLLHPVAWDNGQQMIGKGNMGQSVCVLIKI